MPIVTESELRVQLGSGVPWDRPGRFTVVLDEDTIHHASHHPESSGDVGAGLSRAVNRLSNAVDVLEPQVAVAAAGGQR